MPVAHVLSSEDIALLPGEFGWDRFAGRLGVAPIAAPSSQEALLTRPSGLAEVFLKA